MAHPRDLCTLAEVRRAYGLKDAEHLDLDPEIERRITAISFRAYRKTGREFISMAATELDPAPSETRSFYAGGYARVLRIGDVQEVTAVSADGAILLLGDLVIVGSRAYPDVLQTIEFPSRYYQGVKLDVTGKWGWPAVPPDVSDAVINQTCIELQRDVAKFSETYSLEEGRTERPRAFASAAWDVLDGYRPIGPVFA